MARMSQTFQVCSYKVEIPQDISTGMLKSGRESRLKQRDVSQDV